MSRIDWMFLGVLGVCLLLVFFVFAGYAITVGVWS